jgi:two-component system cell cycle sensor histidine kinase/response regulator CckA
LPWVKLAIEKDDPNVGPTRSLSGSETILLVEDEQSLRDLTRGLLVQSGYTVLETSNGSEALKIAHEHPGNIHLLLTDVVLPGISGSELAEKIVRRDSGAKVLFMSGYTAYAVAAQGILETGTFLLQKPFDPAALRNKVREVLDSVAVKV